MKKLSVIIPIYNEEKTLKKIIENVVQVDLPGFSKEIILVDDGSKDKSLEVAESLKLKEKLLILKHKKNKGKGAAIRTGLKFFTGDFVVIQDGDLEYNPQDFKKMIPLIAEGKTRVVYGSRLLGKISGFNIPSHYLGNKFLSFLTGFLYGRKITDMETCYKLMDKNIAKSLKLNSDKFDIEPEITAKLIKNKINILEIPISYNCRSFKEGKKITWKDGIIAVYTLFKYRFFD